jgi:hypothetical protein
MTPMRSGVMRRSDAALPARLGDRPVLDTNSSTMTARRALSTSVAGPLPLRAG